MHEKLFFRHTFVTLNVRDHNPEHRLSRKNKTSVFVMKQAHITSHISHIEQPKHKGTGQDTTRVVTVFKSDDDDFWMLLPVRAIVTIIIRVIIVIVVVEKKKKKK